MPELVSFPVTTEDFAVNLTIINERIAAACQKHGRETSEVRLLPVSKTVEADRLQAAIAAGATQLAENKPQEIKRKALELVDAAVHWVAIGHLQTNKAKEIANYAQEFQALDSLKVAEALQKRLDPLEKQLEVMIQVNTSAEPAKSGVLPEQVPALLDDLAHFSRLKIQGFMTLAINSPDTEAVRSCFRLLRDVRDRARASHGELIGAANLSMGMSGDYELAIAEGSNCVRIGQAIFGARSYAQN